MSQKKSPPEETNLEEAKEVGNPKQKKRKWLKRLLYFGIFLLLILGIAQGPGLRYAANKYLPGSLESVGFKGTITVEGSIVSGLVIKSVNLTSKGPLQSLQVDELIVDYRLWELLHGRIDGVRVDGLHVWVDIDAKDPNKKEKEDDEPSTVELEKIRQMVLPIAVNISNSSIRLSRGEQTLWQAEEFEIHHESATEDYRLSIGQFTDMENSKLPNQEIVLNWGHNQVDLSGFPLRADTLITKLACTLDNITPTHIQSNINWTDGDFEIRLDDLKKAKPRYKLLFPTSWHRHPKCKLSSASQEKTFAGKTVKSNNSASTPGLKMPD